MRVYWTVTNNGCPLLSRIVVRIAQQRAIYQESLSAGTCLTSRCHAVGRYVTIQNVIVSTLRSFSPVFCLLEMDMEPPEADMLNLTWK
jgi:hypothetical protein